MITAVGWVKRGAAKETPERFAPTEEQIAQYTAMAEEQARAVGGQRRIGEADGIEEEEVDEAGGDGWAEEPAAVPSAASVAAAAAATKAARRLKKGAPKDPSIPAELAEFHFEDYDEHSTDFPLLTSMNKLQFHDSNEEDPYVTTKDESDDEEDDVRIVASDRLVLATKTEDDISNLEVYVYEASEDNLYAHHDVMLPSFPLCLEWLDFEPCSSGDATANFVAIGTFEPEIEIWNLDVVDAFFPHTVLARGVASAAAASADDDGSKPGKQKSKKQDKQKKKQAGDASGSASPAALTGHTDAVLGLAWNRAHRNLLASCSADQTVRLWDLKTGQSIIAYTHHSSKVQSVRWNPAETTVLASGAYDRVVAAWDTRSPGAVGRWPVSADVESMRWDPFDPHCLAVATEDGMVSVLDVRKVGPAAATASVFRLQAHDRVCSAVDYHPLVRKCLVTASFDQTVKVWDIEQNRPSLVHSRNLDIGKLFSASVAGDAPFLVAAAGDKGPLTVWDAWGVTAVRSHFAARLPAGFEEAEDDDSGAME